MIMCEDTGVERLFLLSSLLGVLARAGTTKRNLKAAYMGKCARMPDSEYNNLFHSITVKKLLAPSGVPHKIEWEG
jgi:hypothetical protein